MTGALLVALCIALANWGVTWRKLRTARSTHASASLALAAQRDAAVASVVGHSFAARRRAPDCTLPHQLWNAYAPPPGWGRR